MDKFNIHNWRNQFLYEHHGDDFPQDFLNSTVEELLDQLSEKSTEDYNKVEDIIKKHFSVNEMNVTGTGTTVSAGSGEAYATPFAFKGKGKKSKNRGLEQSKRLGYIPLKK